MSISFNETTGWIRMEGTTAADIGKVTLDTRGTASVFDDRVVFTLGPPGDPSPETATYRIYPGRWPRRSSRASPSRAGRATTRSPTGPGSPASPTGTAATTC